MEPRGRRLREYVAEEIRVLLTRRGMTGSALARELGRSQSYMSRRLTGETAFDMDDVEEIFRYFNIPTSRLRRLIEEALKESASDEGQDTKRYLSLSDRTSHTVTNALHERPDRPNGRPQSGLASVTGPNPVRPARLARAAGR